VWSADEYRKLPAFDGETYEQPPAVFGCHQQDGRLCAGWVAVHDMTQSMGLRIAVLNGMIHEEDVDAIVDYETSVPLFASGAEACAHGLAQIEQPGHAARKTIDKLVKKGVANA
jgi:hypothetical protein